MEKMPTSGEAEMSQSQEVTESRTMGPQTEVESSPENAAEKEQIMESSRVERARLLNAAFVRQIMDIGGSVTPYIGTLKLGIEATVGKTLGGKELSGRERFDYAMIVGCLTVSYVLSFSDMPQESMDMKYMAKAIATLELGPGFLQEAAAMVQGKFPRTASFLDKAGKWLVGDKKNLLDNAAVAVRQFMTGGEGLVLLGLNEE